MLLPFWSRSIRKRPEITVWTSSLPYPKLEGWQLEAAGSTAKH